MRERQLGRRSFADHPHVDGALGALPPGAGADGRGGGLGWIAGRCDRGGSGACTARAEAKMKKAGIAPGLFDSGCADFLFGGCLLAERRIIGIAFLGTTIKGCAVVLIKGRMQLKPFWQIWICDK
mgnify:CR=1 FL=1